MREMQDLRRYLSEQEQAACERLFALVRRKDDLDFHDARQRAAQSSGCSCTSGSRTRWWCWRCCTGCWRIAFRGGAVVREPAPDYSSRQYERPNQPWVCGLASDGHACPAGPTAGGHCPALAECAPVRDGDRWQCNRSALRGGECDEGPTPEGGCGRVHRCQPVRSLRAIRGRFVTACALLAAGGVDDSAQRRLARPSRFAGAACPAARAAVGSATRRQPNCAACHAAAERSVAGWTASLVGRSRRSADAIATVHGMPRRKRFRTSIALAAHNLPAERVARDHRLRAQ